jgi:hypothetical protein
MNEGERGGHLGTVDDHHFFSQDRMKGENETAPFFDWLPPCQGGKWGWEEDTVRARVTCGRR